MAAIVCGLRRTNVQRKCKRRKLIASLTERRDHYVPPVKCAILIGYFWILKTAPIHSSINQVWINILKIYGKLTGILLRVHSFLDMHPSLRSGTGSEKGVDLNFYPPPTPQG